MNPEDIRRITLEIGSKIGLVGGFDMEKPQDNWCDRKIVVGTLEKFIILERFDANVYQIQWDAAAVIALPQAIEVKGYDITDKWKRASIISKKLFLLHRALPNSGNGEWGFHDFDPAVNIFGVPLDVEFHQDVLKADEWVPKTLYLAGYAGMIIENPFWDTWYARTMRKRYEYWQFGDDPDNA